MAGSLAFEAKLNTFLAEAGQLPMDSATVGHFEDYSVLLQRWNARTNLTAIRGEDDILRRHFVECIIAARSLPIQAGTLLDFGSGAGFPGIPIALCLPEMHVTLAESQGKKAAFLREVVRVLELSAQVYSDRAEKLGKTFDCVALRAVDRMDEAIEEAVRLIRPEGWLALLTTTGTQAGFQAVTGTEFTWSAPLPLSASESRILLLGRKSA
jgi:16S rRNA (guanine527-N7)-methyltransferase